MIYLKRYLIKVPSDITILYCNKKQALLIKGALGNKILKLQMKLEIFNLNKLINVTNLPFKKLSNKKTMRSLRGTTVSLIKQAFLEVSTLIYRKLKLVGVGYKIFIIKNEATQVIHFKLGYSHSIYFRVPSSISIKCYKAIKLFISGNRSNYVSQIAALFRSYKIPEPYKGKGILYSNEHIQLKEGKKI